ncbi:Muscle M-line assembly protein unc-89 [Frankliniella fusca]|uniref:Muscle M-line assembly protein unc-89 n=1 Tax=Frankliniella fusca TaxID=407009 RepID=A0AAE1HT38_9NEOP|nr:Muscle M-line assembly protein unc-89 [Frankliniella fusca]
MAVPHEWDEERASKPVCGITLQVAVAIQRRGVVAVAELHCEISDKGPKLWNAFLIRGQPTASTAQSEYSTSSVRIPTAQCEHSPVRVQPSPSTAQCEHIPVRAQPSPSTAQSEYSPVRAHPSPSTAQSEYSPVRLQPSPSTAQSEYSPVRAQRSPSTAQQIDSEAKAVLKPEDAPLLRAAPPGSRPMIPPGKVMGTHAPRAAAANEALLFVFKGPSSVTYKTRSPLQYKAKCAEAQAAGMAAVAHAVPPPLSQPHHAPLSLMSCVSRAAPSPLTSPRASPRCGARPEHHQQQHPEEDPGRHESKKRSFHPLRGLRRMFRRKPRGSGSGSGAQAGETSAPAAAAAEEEHPQLAAGLADPQTAGAATCGPCAPNGAPRSASTGRLLAEAPQHAAPSSRTGALYPGLSVSHDSVFTADPSDQSGSDTTSTQSIQRLVLPGVRHLKRQSEERKAPFLSSLQQDASPLPLGWAGCAWASAGLGEARDLDITLTHKLILWSSSALLEYLEELSAELVDVLRRRTQRGQGRGPGRGGRGQGRGDTSEEDEDLGLPRSPCNSPSDNPLPLPKALRTLQIIRTPGSKLECPTSKNYSPDIELEVSSGRPRYYGSRLGATALGR